ncbi:type II toxin-antitoxin system ParD family antitoxin [Methylobacterium sp. J-030]|uniref:ribbon-helix-helix domain-containing protein n=1 Tax=Methylobacterium sp. J-030 TaxID=2836627 RepID=UPI001FBB3A31|nr:type II toxin-antitoxin system ParD family antitoxin [Methylobacterium sp. J-030]MCJ2069041.1 type II toxin-antitoxin system ParD family antitoxin [Methylobacterium sp. J-030]
MTVVFTEPMAAEIRAAVEAGEYASTGEAVQDAVRPWSTRRQLREQDVAGLRTAWDRGLPSGFVGPPDFGDLRRDAHAGMIVTDDVEHGG